MTRRVLLALALEMAVAVSGVAGCGGERAAPAAPKREAVAAWPDAFDVVPELFFVVRPQLVKRDAVYGPLFTSAMRMALARSALAGTTGIEVLEAVDEVIVGIHRDPDSPVEDATIVYRGVPSSFDPVKLVDERGVPLFRVVDDRARVPEYAPSTTRARASGDAGLFVLPDRTWVLAAGQARARARQAFGSPRGRPSPKLVEGALAVVRLGPEIAASPRYQKSPVFGPLTRRLTSATLILDPGKQGVRVLLSYEDDDATAWSEMHAKRITSELARVDARRFGWMNDATFARDAKTVTVTLPIPPRLLEELPKASATDLPL